GIISENSIKGYNFEYINMSYAQGRGLAGRSRQDGGETKNGQQDGQAQQPGDIKAFFHVRLPAAY
ncbi:hypothetical protein, partial [Desulfovibrio sp.]|uniref:hypothetical protein n=1 Tax=Desulfovibrio sp. TaxID=885 RepID=UPI0030775686